MICLSLPFFFLPLLESLTSMPSLLRAYSSKLRMAVLMVRGGGRTVRPILMALLLLESKTMISWRLPSAAVFWSIKIQTGEGVTAGSLFCSLLYFLRLVSQCGLVYGLVRIRGPITQVTLIAAVGTKWAVEAGNTMTD